MKDRVVIGNHSMNSKTAYMSFDDDIDDDFDEESSDDED